MIPESFIQELLSRVDIVDVVGKYVQLKKGGANFIGLCPFHNEKSPSFTVSPSKQFYHCFGCGASGSAIKFVMEHTGSSFPEAVERLASNMGMTVPKEHFSPAQEVAYKQKVIYQQTLSDVLTLAQSHYQSSLKTYPAATEYLANRGLSSSIIDRWGLGWSGGYQSLETIFVDYQSNKQLIEAGMVVQQETGRLYDRFHHRVTFPIYNEKGQLIAFGGRILGDGKPKYLNSPETPLFNKSESLYGLWENKKSIHKQNQVLVVEGYMDVVSLSQFGVDYAVATLGTAITEQHLRKLMRAADCIIFSFDGDTAGQKAADKAFLQCLPMLKDDVVIRFLFLPQEHDPDSYIRAFGVTDFEQRLSHSMPLSDYFLNYFKTRYKLTESEGKSACMKASFDLFKQMPDIVLTGQIVRQFVELLGVSLSEFKQYLARYTQIGSVSSPVVENTGGYAKKTVRRTKPVKTAGTILSVEPLALRLMGLLVSQPELVHHTNSFYFKLIFDDPVLVDLKRLIMHLMNYPPLNTAGLLHSITKDSNLYAVVHHLACKGVDVGDTVDVQWQDGMKKLHIQALKKELKALLNKDMDEENKARYHVLSQEIIRLESSS